MRTIFLYLLLATYFTSSAQSNLVTVLKKYNKESIPYIKVDQLDKAQNIYLDAREANEFKISHLPNAIYVGYNYFKNKQILTHVPDKNASIVVYCSIGVRSEQIAEKIKKLGYKNVYNLYGGIFEYKNSGYKVFNNANKPTDSVHTYNKEWSTYLTKGIKVYEH